MTELGGGRALLGKISMEEGAAIEASMIPGMLSIVGPLTIF
jgi:hypothetical protein